MQKNRDKKQALKFNSLVLGIQNYYKKATMCNRDFVSIGYKINKVLYNRIGKSSYKKDALNTKLYPKYNYRVWNIQNITLFTIQACKFKIPKKYGGKDEIDNLVLLKPEIHTKLHNKETNEFYKSIKNNF